MPVGANPPLNVAMSVGEAEGFVAVIDEPELACVTRAGATFVTVVTSFGAPCSSAARTVTST